MSICTHGNKRPCFACEYDGEPAGAYKYDWRCGKCKKLRNLCLCDEDEAVYFPIRFKTKVTGNDNPFYDLPYPVNSLRELVRAIDPHMSYCRYNIFKVGFRWEDKPNLRYNLEKARDSIDEALLSLPED